MDARITVEFKMNGATKDVAELIKTPTIIRSTMRID